jgi:hypothetical protein
MGERYFFVLFLIFLVACQPYIQAVPTSERQAPVEAELSAPETDNCAEVACPSGQTCIDGKCSCPFGEKMCDGDCIDQDGCCADNDCASGVCEDGRCEATPDCEYGEVFKNGECQCAADKTYCKEQGKCIDRGDCCVHSQCDRFNRCVETGWRVSLCARVDEKKLCKVLADLGRTEEFEIKGTEFTAKPLMWLSDGSVDINISNTTIRISENVTTSYGNITLFQEGIEVTGGFCKEDEDE